MKRSGCRRHHGKQKEEKRRERLFSLLSFDGVSCGVLTSVERVPMKIVFFITKLADFF